MPNTEPKRAASIAQAQSLYDRLMAIGRPIELSNNEWAKRAGVNTSFFTNLKNGSQPSVENFKAVLQVVGSSLPEFFLEDANGRLAHRPNSEELEAAILAALPGLPRNPDRRAQYLAEVVLDVLELRLPLLAKRDVHSKSGQDESRAA